MPKRKGSKGKAAPKSGKKAKPAEEQEAGKPEQGENAAEEVKEAPEEKQEATGESGKAEPAEEKKKGEEAAEEGKKGEGEEEEEKKDEGAKKKEAEKKDEEKPAGKRGRKKAPLVPGTKRVTRSNPGPKEDDEAHAAKKSVHIIIEHFRAPVFKRKAERMRDELLTLESEEVNFTVAFNPDKLKPADGKFVVRDNTGQVFLDLEDTTKPFSKLKELDVEAVANDILKQSS